MRNLIVAAVFALGASFGTAGVSTSHSAVDQINQDQASDSTATNGAWYCVIVPGWCERLDEH